MAGMRLRLLAVSAGLLLGGTFCTRTAVEAPGSATTAPVPSELLFEQIRSAVSQERYDLASALIEENQGRFFDARTLDRLNFMRGWIALSQNDRRLARVWFEQIPDSNLALTPLALYFRAKSLVQDGDRESAARLFEQLMQKFPLSRRAVEARFDLAGLYFANGQFDQALDFYEMMRRNPNLQGEQYLANRAPVVLNSGDALAALGRREEALSKYEDLYYDFPLSPEAQAAAERMVQVRQALGSPAFTASPDRTLKRARRLLDGGQSRQAVQEIETVLPVHREKGGKAAIDALTLYAQALERERRFTEARTVYDQIAGIPGADVASMRLKTANATVRTNEDLGIQRLLKVAEEFPKSAAAPDALYNAARFHHVAGRDPDAAALYQQIITAYPKSSLAASSTFQLGWFDFLAGRYPEAAGWFQKASEFPADADEYERSLYWLARTREKSGDTAGARELYTKLWNERSWHYYGAMAKGRLDGLAAPDIYRQMLPQNPRGVAMDPAGLRHEPELVQIAQAFGGMRRDSVQSAVELIVLGLFREASDELDFVAQGNPDTEQVSRLLPLFEETRDYQRLRTWGWNTLGKPSVPEVANVRSWRALYPKAYLGHVNGMAAENRLDARFILSIIREESAYDPRALSAANAHGLMQLIPPTANNVARSLNLPPVQVSDLRNPPLNIRLGSTYLRQLVDDFQGNMVFAIASYNGGPHNVNKWRERLAALDLDEFVEEIPFRETRNYVKKIFKSWSNYRLLYGPDIERLYAQAIEQLIAPAPGPGVSALPVHLEPAESSGWVRPGTLTAPPVPLLVMSGPVRLSGMDEQEKAESQKAMKAVRNPQNPPGLDGFDPAHDYQTIVGDDGLPAESSVPIQLSDWMNGAQP